MKKFTLFLVALSLVFLFAASSPSFAQPSGLVYRSSNSSHYSNVIVTLLPSGDLMLQDSSGMYYYKSTGVYNNFFVYENAQTVSRLMMSPDFTFFSLMFQSGQMFFFSLL